jgi:PhnB protein
VETLRLDMPDGRIGHAEIAIGGAQVMLADEFPEGGHCGPESLGGTTVSISVIVANVDAFADRAVAAGVALERPVKTEFYGERVAVMRDPFGHRWMFRQPIEALSADEMKRRMSAGTV